MQRDDQLVDLGVQRGVVAAATPLGVPLDAAATPHADAYGTMP